MPRFRPDILAYDQFGDGFEPLDVETIVDLELTGPDGGGAVVAREGKTQASVGRLVGERAIARVDQLSRSPEREQLQVEARERGVRETRSE